MILILIIVAGFGLLLGSFANAVVWRLHEQGAGYEDDERPKRTVKADVSISHGRSMCPHCEHQLSALDLIPVLSWLMLGGKCRYCKKPISMQYPAVELLMAGLFVLNAMAYNPTTLTSWLRLAVWLGFVVTLVILAIYDARWQLLPDRLLKPITALAMMMILLYYLDRTYTSADIINYGLTGFIAGGVFFAIAAVSGGKWMGGGDIKLVTLMGLLLGGSKMALAMLIAFNSAAIVGLGLILVGRKKRRDMLAFGPFLIAATFVAQLYGERIIAWYLRLNGLG
jgi:prepilin signal peptidase PulO-like enzyme (type II secretory pathway)